MSDMSLDWMSGSSRPFSRVLVANRGEIAIRVLRAVNESGLTSVAIFSDSDEKSMHVEIADRSVHLPGESLEETYLNGEAIIEAAISSEADATVSYTHLRAHET